MDEALKLPATPAQRELAYHRVGEALASLLDGEDDWVAAMATVVCELHHAFDYYDWTGFYRAVSDDLLVVGPYQGGHGCLRIPFARGVCGAAARTKETQLVPDVHAFEDHIACAASTQSELVVPVLTPDGRLLAVLDVDSDSRSAFDETDRRELEAICADLGRRFA
ncbi:MAG TPA: GAF domain-containing protein [Sandaracinaceae bacterium LLY-WYZ-13_1]|nr:GAF domain-containing protein [Sandaracinaceae bacterium LLY-WYZ-13_1]